MGKSKNRDKGHQQQHSSETMKGTLDIARSGMGFVIVDGMEKDIVVRPHDFNGAFSGNIVRVQITKAGSMGRRYEGKITEVLERKQTEFVGTVEVSSNFAFVAIDSKKTIPDFFVHPKRLNGAKDGDRVIVKFLQWQKDDKKPEGEIMQVLKAEDVNDMAMKGILIENNFPLEFSNDVMEEALRLTDIIGEDEIAKRKDVRDILTVTIDPVDAKDFDDAISFRMLRNGLWEIGVHIADVSHFVLPGTKLDESAYERATSVYLPDRVNPMLPERISNELCSLRPHEDKCTFSCIFQINEKAEVKHYWIGRTVIHSDHRFTYEDVQETIEKREGIHEKEIWILNDLAQKLRRKRFAAGAINFSSQEVRFKLDEKGKPIGIVIKESKEAHQLIEEFMLLANQTVAEYVSKIKINKKPIPFPYRIHATPDDEKLKPFAAFAKKFGYKFDIHDEEAVASSFNKLLKEVQGKPEQHVLEQLGIRTMAKAIYTAENIGHYGLGFEHYTHFTSPIRRYPDVMVHRILQECLDKDPQIDKKMEEKCKHCSERERGAMDSERAGNKYKQVEYMQDYLGEEFDGIISGVSTFGFWVETVEHKCEGLVSARDLLTFDDFRLDETDYALVGLRTGKKFRMGDLVTIKVISANLSKRQMDYEWVMDEKSKLKTVDERKPKNEGKEKHKKKKKGK
ncbi:MAG: ribonuclease R [Ferruginibacter sp.]